MKILLVNPNNIGDVVLSTPILDALHVLYPGCEITCVVKNRCKGVLAKDRRISSIGTFDFRHTSERDEERQRFFEALSVPWQTQTFDLALVTQSDIRANLMIRSWIGFTPFWGLVDRANQYYGSKAKLRSGGFLLTRPVYNDSPNMHQVRRLWRIVKAMDSTRLLPNEPFLPSLTPTPLDPEVFPRKPYMIVHPGANITMKMWPLTKMARVIKELRPLFSRIVVVGSKGDKPHGEILASLSGCVDNRCGSMSLDTLASFIGGSSLYLGNDTGPTHMAAAMGIPVVSIISGKNQALRWGPYRPHDDTAKAVWPEDTLVREPWMDPDLIWRSLSEHEVINACLDVLATSRSTAFDRPNQYTLEAS